MKITIQNEDNNVQIIHDDSTKFEFDLGATVDLTGFIKFISESQNPIECEPESFEKFKDDEQNWLKPFSTFMAIKEQHGGVAWNEWPEPLRSRDSQTLKSFTREHAQEIEFQAYLQFIFHRQWCALHNYAASKGIRIIGDIPIL